MLLNNEVYHHGIFFLDNYAGSNKHIGRSVVFFFSSKKSFKLSSEQDSKVASYIFNMHMYVVLIFSEINYIVLGY